jgi:hypothetical protein
MTDTAEIQQQHQEPRPNTAVASRKQEDIQQYCQAYSQTGGHEVRIRVSHQAAENEWLNIVKEQVTTAQAEEEILATIGRFCLH